MIKVLVSCANGAGTSLMMKMTAEKVLKDLNVPVLEVHHCSLSEGKSVASNYDIVFCSLNFIDMFKEAENKGTTVIGIKNVLSGPEIKERLLASGALDKLNE